MEFETSLAEGPHALLARLVGRYEGRARLWMVPGEPDDDETATGEIAAVAGGRFVRHDYVTRIGGEDQSGSALVGCDLGQAKWVASWIDTWHTGTGLMSFEGTCDEAATTVDLRSAYGAVEEGESVAEQWGWRTTFEPTDEGVVVRHYNVPPVGSELGGEYVAVQFDYKRIG